jgi:hypothetical protein
MAHGEFYDDGKDSDEHAVFTMLNCLILTCGADVRRPSKTGGRPSRSRFEEEVHVYLESLRKALADPPSTERLTPYLFEYDIEALRRLRRSGNARLRYTILSAPSTALIVSLGVFDSAGEGAVPCGPKFKHGSQGQMGRGEAYYHFAFSYADRVADVGAAVRGLDQALTTGLTKFATILAYSIGAPFALADRLDDGDVYQFVRTTEGACRQIRIERKQDEFLDAYLVWRQCRSEEAKKQVLLRADELHKIDPGFTYAP